MNDFVDQFFFWHCFIATEFNIIIINMQALHMVLLSQQKRININ